VLKILLFALPLLLTLDAQAATFYVTDEFRVPLRTGQTNAYRIRAELTSGTSVELLKSNRGTGYSKVRTKKGTEGWILTRYLINQPVARFKLATAEKKIDQLVQQREDLLAGQTDWQATAETTQQDNAALHEVNNKLVEELEYIKEVSGNTVQINQLNQQLIEKNQQLNNQLELLSAENDRLEGDSTHDFFMLGAGAILLGVVVGLVAPSFRLRRKDSDWI